MILPALEVLTMEQGTPEWHAARCGVITASEFDSVLAKGKAGAPSKTRATYMRRKVGELITGQVDGGFGGNAHTERGHAMEPDARNLWAFTTGLEFEPVGFMRRGPVGCSPDSLVGAEGLLEIKTKLPHLHLELLDDDAVPNEHTAQIQGQLWVSGRQWCEFVSYWPGLPIFIKRVQRDDTYIARLAIEVADFITEMNAYRASIQSRYYAKAA